MSRKIFTYFLVFISVSVCFLGAFAASRAPLFAEFSDTFELYLKKGSFDSYITTVGIEDYRLSGDVEGEGCTVKEGITAEEIMRAFSATVVFGEETEDGISYYCYSENIRYRENLKGKEVNLQIFESSRGIKIGAPLIYGSF